MSRDEAEALIRRTEGDICIRMFKRTDGTVIVDNCPVGLRAARRQLRWIAAGVAAALTFMGGVALAFTPESRHASLKQWFFPPQPPIPQKQCVMGKPAFRPAPPSAPTPANGSSYVGPDAGDLGE